MLWRGQPERDADPSNLFLPITWSRLIAIFTNDHLASKTPVQPTCSDAAAFRNERSREPVRLHLGARTCGRIDLTSENGPAGNRNIVSSSPSLRNALGLSLTSVGSMTSCSTGRVIRPRSRRCFLQKLWHTGCKAQRWD